MIELSDECIDDIINSYHGTIKAMAEELKLRRANDAPPQQRDHHRSAPYRFTAYPPLIAAGSLSRGSIVINSTR
jgi:hypothetical protein